MIVVFDLDDTLYPELDFVKSGFAHLANLISPQNPLPIQALLWELFQEDAKHVIDRLMAKIQTHFSREDLIEHYRFHVPDLRLDPETIRVLDHLKAKGPLSLITDGRLQTQQQKYKALGLSQWIDFPIFSAEFATQKPDPMLFKMVMAHFPDKKDFVYIADNPKKDFIAPDQLGWKSIRIKRENGVYADIPFAGEWEILSIEEAIPILAKL